MRITPVAGALGAVLEDVDPRDPDLDFGAVYGALLEHEVIFFPQVHLTEAEHMAFGRRFGEPSIFPVARARGATAPTMTVIEDEAGTPNAADEWHTDVTWIQTPPKCALLHMGVVPERGGDTLWCSATRAYDALSPRFQTLLDGLVAVHDNEGFFRGVQRKMGTEGDGLIEFLRREYPPVEHPLVRTHPETGKRALMYSAQFLRRIKDMSEEESRTIVRFLDEHVKDPSLHCRWHWSEGDLAVWDERSTLHRAAADHFPHRRVIRRLEIDGDRPYFDPTATPRAKVAVAG
jgi:taurine dioxygenase